MLSKLFNIAPQTDVKQFIAAPNFLIDTYLDSPSSEQIFFISAWQDHLQQKFPMVLFGAQLTAAKHRVSFG